MSRFGKENLFLKPEILFEKPAVFPGKFSQIFEINLGFDQLNLIEQINDENQKAFSVNIREYEKC